MDEMHTLFKTEPIYDLLQKEDRSIALVDIGCRGGYFLEQLARRGFNNLHGVDYIEIAGPFTFHKVNMSYESLPFSDASIDVINYIQVLHGLENPFHAMREIKRVLKQGGVFIYNVININNIQERLNFLLAGNISDVKYSGEAVTYFNNAVQHKLFDDFIVLFKLYSKGHPPFIPITRALSKYRYLGRLMSMYKRIKLPRFAYTASRILYVAKKK